MSRVEALDLLKEYWGYDSFRSPQDKVIETVLSGKDAIVLLPTGGGKSLCYQLPSLLLPGLTLVVSPLISLMQDQILQLHQRGIKAALLHGGMHKSEIKKTLDETVKGQYDLLYMAPERLSNSDMMEYLRSAKLKLVAMDEAHCISQWGHDFRPSYLKVSVVREAFPDVPVVALTGTATEVVLNDVSTILKLNDPVIFRAGFERKNIQTYVLEEDNKLSMTLHLLKERHSSIVYVRSRRTSVELAHLLNQRGINAAPYHAGMNTTDRERTQKLWISDEITCMVATSAFGMGVDKPDVRTVIHFELPPSVEDYYQEIGRAGRDGNLSQAYLIYNRLDRQNLIRKNERDHISKEDLQRVYQLICSYYKVSPEAYESRQLPFELHAFSEHYQLDPQLVRKSMLWLVEREYLEVYEGMDLQSRLMILSQKHDLDHINEHRPEEGRVLRAMLRSYEGLFAVPVPINETKLSEHVESTPDRVVAILDRLHKRGVVDYQKAVTGHSLKINGVREWTNRLDLDYQQFATNQTRKRQRAEAILKYLELETCRTSWLLRYFNEDKNEDCGHCDICLGINEVEFDRLDKTRYHGEIVDILEIERLSLPELLKRFPLIHRKALLHLIEEMVLHREVVVKDATFMLPVRGEK